MSLFHDAPVDDPGSAKRRARIAAEFKTDPQTERLAQLRAEDPRHFDQVFGPRGQIMIGMYEAQKRIAKEEGTHR